MLTVSGCSHPFVLSAGGAGEFPRLVKRIQSFFMQINPYHFVDSVTLSSC